jgi:hypothetical protein
VASKEEHARRKKERKRNMNIKMRRGAINTTRRQ